MKLKDIFETALGIVFLMLLPVGSLLLWMTPGLVLYGLKLLRDALLVM